jgi:hypothetical protein
MGAFDKIADSAAEKLAQKTAEQLPQDPTQQAVAKIPTKKAATVPAAPVNNLSAVDASKLGLSGGDVAVDPGTLEPSQGQHVVPGTTSSPPNAPEAPASPQPIPPEIQSVPMVAKQAPTTKEMIANVLSHTGPEGEMVVPAGEKKGEGVDWVGMLKGAGSGLGDFLQRWGLGLQGKGEAPTQGDIQRAQAFELKKQAAANDLTQRNMALDNTYQSQRMAIMQDYNKANLTQQEKAARDNALAQIDAQYQNEKALLPQKVALERQQMQYQNSVNASAPNPAVATILKGK